MFVIDAQLHEPPMSFEWADADRLTRFELMTEVTLAYMRAIGVDRAVLHPTGGPEWGEYASARMPDRFTLVVGPLVASEDGTMTMHGPAGPVRIPSVDDWVVEKSRTPGVAGIRLTRPSAELCGPALEACAREGLPVFVLPPSPSGDPREYGGVFTGIATITHRHPDLTVVIDHLGLPQWPATLDSPPFRALPALLELAAHPNVAIKFSGAPSMSQRPYPFEDLWPDLRRIVDAFGPRRLMWGTDISRFYGRIGFRSFPEFSSAGEFAYRDGIAPELVSPERAHEVPHSYAEALFFLRDSDQLSADEKEWLLGRTAQTLLRWPADARPATHMAP